MFETFDKAFNEASSVAQSELRNALTNNFDGIVNELETCPCSIIEQVFGKDVVTALSARVKMEELASDYAELFKNNNKLFSNNQNIGLASARDVSLYALRVLLFNEVENRSTIIINQFYHLIKFRPSIAKEFGERFLLAKDLYFSTFDAMSKAEWFFKEDN